VTQYKHPCLLPIDLIRHAQPLSEEALIHTPEQVLKGLDCAALIG
jgi:hypothetical protein